MPSLFTIRDLSTTFATDAGPLVAVDRLSFNVERHETLAIVGESGSGKSVTALSILRLLPKATTTITAAAMDLDGYDLTRLNDRQLQEMRGKDIGMIFQEPMTSLNPVLTIGEQITEAIHAHQVMSRQQAWVQAGDLLRRVRVPDTEQKLRDYPHRLSGGMRQRVMIAIALAGRPKMLIADEPTTALDVTIQAQILGLLRQLQREFGTGVVLITHNLGVVAEVAQRMVVMYAGRKVEEGSVHEVFRRPLHPYTEGLLRATPHVAGGGMPEPAGKRAPGAPSAGPPAAHGARLYEIPGIVPALSDLPSGCAFAPRCQYAFARCHAEHPPLVAMGSGEVACWIAEQRAAA